MTAAAATNTETRKPRAKPEPPRPLAYRPKGAAAVLGVSQSQIYKLIGEGKLAASKLTGVTLIRHDELERMLSTATPIVPGSGKPAAPRTTKPAQASIK